MSGADSSGGDESALEKCTSDLASCGERGGSNHSGCAVHAILGMAPITAKFNIVTLCNFHVPEPLHFAIFMSLSCARLNTSAQ